MEPHDRVNSLCDENRCECPWSAPTEVVHQLG